MYTHPSYAINYYGEKNVNNDKLEMNRIPTVTQENVFGYNAFQSSHVMYLKYNSKQTLMKPSKN